MTYDGLYIGNHTNLNPSKITNLYLYGQADIPSDYSSRARTQSETNSLPVRPVGPGGSNVHVLPIALDMDSFMSTGPGRFARASKAQIVDDFFNNNINPTSYGLSATGTYTAAQLTSAGIPASKFGINLEQATIDGSSLDYADRSYIYNNGAFKISDDTKFVFQNGQPVRLEDLSVHARDDNFDFDSASLGSSIPNIYLKPYIDPSSIGVRVEIEFRHADGSENKYDVPTYEEKTGHHYGASDYQADQGLDNLEPVGNPDNLVDGVANILNDLREAGIINSSATWLRGLLQELIEAVKDLYGLAQVLGSPLVLDLSHNNTVDLVSLANSTTFFDLTGSGFANRTGWVSPNDGFLALDKNGNGLIDSGKELFGTASGAAGGFEDLAAYDSNGDGFITQEDTVWGQLRVWKDTNGSGFSESGELQTLGSLGITSIGLSFTDSTGTNQGHLVAELGTFTQNGNSYKIQDIWFQYDPMISLYAEDFDVSYDALLLNMNLRGYGFLPDLHASNSLDDAGTGNLLSLVESLSAKTFSQLFDSTSTVPDLVRSILFRWAGVDGVSPTSRGSHVNGQELGFLEKLAGEAFLGQGIYPNPGPSPGYELTDAFRLAYNAMYARLLAQGAGRELFTGAPVYDIASDAVTGITGLNLTKLGELESEAAGLSTTAQRQAFWDNAVRMVEYAYGTANLTTTQRAALADAIDGSSSGSLELGSNAEGAETGILGDLLGLRAKGETWNGTNAGETKTGGALDDVDDSENDSLWILNADHFQKRNYQLNSHVSMA